ncbi:hypothetical protein J15TS10_05230 [Paenibacillus woosongensis]|uniref:UbiC transcription regulator-associated domain-containing protein n=1 Tax=Paenibacillus woosongensis TaxID=307580 RepID=A0ABQ4MLB5_9BACL|nr:hypothetical protein J15TS10_05230 [Paenibacillus woosongensis]
MQHTLTLDKVELIEKSESDYMLVRRRIYEASSYKCILDVNR